MQHTKTLPILLFLLFPLGLRSQTAVWQMQPGEWSELTRMGRDLYKAVRPDGRMGLLRSDGTALMSVGNYQMSEFYEQKALITQNDAKGERVTGCLTNDGQYYAYNRKYYTLNGQKFFSDGLLTVTDEQGNLGYIDIEGREQIGFDGKLSRIKPFSEQYAVVVKGKKYTLINTQGEEMRLVIGGTGVGEISSFTNAYHGIIYAYDSYNEKFYTYDVRTKAPMKGTSFMKGKDKSMDYLYCFQAVSGRNKEVPFETPKPYQGQKGAISTNEGGRYGYESHEHTILPCQFDAAETFMDNLAIVSLNGQKGVLRWVEGGSFDATATTTQHDFYAGDNVQCQFTLSIPEAWRGKSLEVELRNQEGKIVSAQNTGTTYTFTQTPANSQQCTYTLKVRGEGLHLFNNTLSYTFTRKERPVPVTGTKICPDPKCGKPISQCPFGGKHYKAH